MSDLDKPFEAESEYLYKKRIAELEADKRYLKSAITTLRREIDADTGCNRVQLACRNARIAELEKAMSDVRKVLMIAQDCLTEIKYICPEYIEAYAKASDCLKRLATTGRVKVPPLFDRTSKKEWVR